MDRLEQDRERLAELERTSAPAADLEDARGRLTQLEEELRRAHEQAPEVSRLDAELASLRSLVEELQVARERVAEQAAGAPALAGQQAAELREHAQSLATVVEARAARVEEVLEDALRQSREAARMVATAENFASRAAQAADTAQAGSEATAQSIREAESRAEELGEIWAAAEARVAEVTALVSAAGEGASQGLRGVGRGRGPAGRCRRDRGRRGAACRARCELAEAASEAEGHAAADGRDDGRGREPGGRAPGDAGRLRGDGPPRALGRWRPPRSSWSRCGSRRRRPRLRQPAPAEADVRGRCPGGPHRAACERQRRADRRAASAAASAAEQHAEQSHGRRGGHRGARRPVPADRGRGGGRRGRGARGRRHRGAPKRAGNRSCEQRRPARRPRRRTRAHIGSYEQALAEARELAERQAKRAEAAASAAQEAAAEVLRLASDRTTDGPAVPAAPLPPARVSWQGNGAAAAPRTSAPGSGIAARCLLAATPGPPGPRDPGFDDAPVPMASIQLDGRFADLNPAFTDLVGYAEADFQSACWPPVTDRANLEKHREQVRQMLAGEIESATVDTSYVHAQGLLVPVAGRLSLDTRGGRPQSLPARSRLVVAFARGAAGVWWPIRSSKPAGRRSPALGRFDSFAAP